MKKLIAIGLCFGAVLTASAWCGPGGWGYGPGPCRPCYGYGGGWGRGGCNFWPSFAGAAAGAVIGNALSQPRTVVVQPSYTPVVTQPVIVQPTTYVRPAYTSECIIGTPSSTTVIYR